MDGLAEEPGGVCAAAVQVAPPSRRLSWRHPCRHRLELLKNYPHFDRRVCGGEDAPATAGETPALRSNLGIRYGTFACSRVSSGT